MNEKTEKTSTNSGDFRADGSWNTAAEKSERGPRYEFVKSLCRVRRAAGLSPAELSDQIEASTFAAMFGELAQWKTLTSWRLWPLAWARTSADRAVISAGVGSPKESHWEGGIFAAGEDRPFVSADPAKVAEFCTTGIAALCDTLAMPNETKSVPSLNAPTPATGHADESWFEGKSWPTGKA